jgi:AcrR family transcriptional regulator
MAETLTPEKILETGEQVLRRFGPAKATVVDVARALGVSHGSVYRHFASKAELRDAVVERWLKRTSDPLGKIAESKGPAPVRLRRWFEALIASKRQKVKDDPEMFATSRELFAESGDVVARHMAIIVGQIETILRAGVEEGSFAIDDTHATAQALVNALARFHDPAHAREWSDPSIDKAFEGVWALLISAISAGR